MLILLSRRDVAQNITEFVFGVCATSLPKAEPGGHIAIKMPDGAVVSIL